MSLVHAQMSSVFVKLALSVILWTPIYVQYVVLPEFQTVPCLDVFCIPIFVTVPCNFRETNGLQVWFEPLIRPLSSSCLCDHITFFGLCISTLYVT